MSLKRKLVFLVVLVALAASAAGAYAATQTASGTSRQAFLNDVAKRLHVTPQQLRRAVDGAFADRLAALVRAGRMTKAQAAAIEKQVRSGTGAFPLFGIARVLPGAMSASGRLQAVPVPFPPAAPVRRGARRPRGLQVPVPASKLRLLRHGWYAYPPGGPPPAVAMRPGLAVPFGFGLMMPAGVKAALSYLDIKPAKLQAELRAGKSLAQIAAAQGKSASGLVSRVEATVKAHLVRQVAAKRITSTQAKKIESMLDARIAFLVKHRLSGMMWARARRPFFARPGIWRGPPRGGSKVKPRPAAALFGPA